MIGYFKTLGRIWSGPFRFFESVFQGSEGRGGFRFAAWTGFLIALELGLTEILAGGAYWIVGLVTVAMILALPVLFWAGAHLWAWFMGLCAKLLGEELPYRILLTAAAYSTAGLAALGFGIGIGKWPALFSVWFLFAAAVGGLRCSKWEAAVYVGLPVSVVGVMLAFFTFIFKVYS